MHILRRNLITPDVFSGRRSIPPPLLTVLEFLLQLTVSNASLVTSESQSAERAATT